MPAVRDPIFGCLLVTSRLDPEGYAYHGRSRAHRVAWERAHGSIADGLELDHLCRRRACVELVHLELVVRAENERRKSWAWRVRRKRCPRGHELRYAVITPEGGRLCRTCTRELLSSSPRTA